MLLLLLLVAGVTNTLAQSVTVEPSTGNLIAALTSGTEAGFENGWSAMWRHEQLPLTFTVSDESTLTDGGEIKNPAGNIRKHKKNNEVGEKLIIIGGVQMDGYMVLSLPKGYRITGYRMVLLNNINNYTITTQSGGYTQTTTSGSPTKTVYETDSKYDYNHPLAQTPTMGRTNSDTQEYVIWVINSISVWCMIIVVCLCLLLSLLRFILRLKVTLAQIFSLPM